jgi:hypothetical protein
MSNNPYIALIEGLNSGESLDDNLSASPVDYAAELSLWTNAEFTFDMPPGLGIFESDSGFDQLATVNTVLLNDSSISDSSINGSAAETVAAARSNDQQDPVLGQHMDAHQHTVHIMNNLSAIQGI